MARKLFSSKERWERFQRRTPRDARHYGLTDEQRGVLLSSEDTQISTRISLPSGMYTYAAQGTTNKEIVMQLQEVGLISIMGEEDGVIIFGFTPEGIAISQRLLRSEGSPDD